MCISVSGNSIRGAESNTAILAMTAETRLAGNASVGVQAAGARSLIMESGPVLQYTRWHHSSRLAHLCESGGAAGGVFVLARAAEMAYKRKRPRAGYLGACTQRVAVGGDSPPGMLSVLFLY